MDLYQEVAALQRLFRNLIRMGSVISVDGSRVVVKLDVEGGSVTGLLTGKLPLIGRGSAQVGEPVIVMLPDADPANGWVFCLQYDPQIESLQARLNAVEQQLQLLEQQVNYLGQSNE